MLPDVGSSTRFFCIQEQLCGNKETLHQLCVKPSSCGARAGLESLGAGEGLTNFQGINLQWMGPFFINTTSQGTLGVQLEE